MPDAPVLAILASAPGHKGLAVRGWTPQIVATGRQEFVSVDDPLFLPLLDAAQALVLTSPRAARWLAARDVPAASLRPVLVSGPATGALLPDRWMRLVPPSSGGSAVADLAASRGLSRLLHLCAEETAGTLERRASALGLELSRLVVYRTAALPDLSPADRDVLDRARATVFLAPSAVRHLAELDPHRFEFLSRRLVAVACGEATGEQLLRSGWRTVRLARSTSAADIAAILEVP